MRRFALITAILACVSVQAKNIDTKIVHIQPPYEKGANFEVFTTYNGRVFEVETKNIELLERLYAAKNANSLVRIRVQAGAEYDLLKIMENITEVAPYSLDQVPLFQVKSNSNYAHLDPMTGYVPNDIGDYARANQIFGQLYTRTKFFTQCFNRAHIWAKQMHDYYRVDSMKILIYYTKKYRREIDKKWWFHIAPMVLADGEYYVMDKEFTRKPISPKEWEKVFTSKLGSRNYRCKKIRNIGEYYDRTNTYSEYCNIQYTSMYYWEPNDMSRLEKTGEQKTHWVKGEIYTAAREAFRNWREIVRRHSY